MKASYLFTILISLLGHVCCLGQEINWAGSKHWKVYNLRNKLAFELSIDSIKQFGSIDLDDETMSHLMKGAKVWPIEKYSLWMGLFMVSCETSDGIKRKVIISNYAGFFYDQLTRRYYQVSPEMVDSLLEWLNKRSKDLILSLEN